MTEITEDMVEAAAEASWRAEVSEISAARRARETSSWEDQQEELKAKWRHLTRAALTAAFASRPSQDGEWVDRMRRALKEYDDAVQWHSYRLHDVNREADQHKAAAKLAETVRAMLSASPSPYGVEAGVVRDALTASRSVIVGLIDAEYNIETWGLKQRLAAIDDALSLTKDQSNG